MNLGMEVKFSMTILISSFIHLLKFCVPVFGNSLFQLVEWYMLACCIIYRELETKNQDKLFLKPNIFFKIKLAVLISLLNALEHL